MALLYNISRIAAVSEASYEQGQDNARRVGAGIFGSNLSRTTDEALAIAAYGSNTAVYASNTAACALGIAVEGVALANGLSQRLQTVSQTLLTTSVEAAYASNAAYQYFSSAVVNGNKTAYAYNTAVAASAAAATATTASANTSADVARYALALTRANLATLGSTNSATNASAYASNTAGVVYETCVYASNAAGSALSAAGYASNTAGVALSTSSGAADLASSALAASAYASNGVVSTCNAARVRSTLGLAGLSSVYLGQAPVLTVTQQGLIGVACAPSLYGLQVAQTVRMAGRGGTDVPPSIINSQLSNATFYGGNDGIMYGTVTLTGATTPTLAHGQGMSVSVPLGFKTGAPYLVSATSVAGALPCRVTGKTSNAFTLHMFNPYLEDQAVAGCVVDFHIVLPI